jgi:hypothetical protein
VDGVGLDVFGVEPDAWLRCTQTAQGIDQPL